MGMLGGLGGAAGAMNVRLGAQTAGFVPQLQRALTQGQVATANAAKNMQASGQRVQKSFSLIGAAFKIGAVGIVGGLTAATAAAIQFESSWAGVRKTLNASDEELLSLRNQFRELAKTIPVSLNELAKIGETAGALGIPKEAIIDFVKTVALIGSTTNVTTDEAATALGQLGNVLKMQREDYAKFGATLVDLGNKGASTEAQILGIASRAGAAGGMIGLSIPQVLAFGSAVANLGIEVEAGGSSLQNFFLKMNKAVAGGADAAKTIAKVSGTSVAEFKRLWEQDAGEALYTFIAGLGKLDSGSKQAVLGLLKMNDIRITRMLLGMAGGVDMVRYSLDTGTAAWKANTAMTTEAEKRFQTTASAMGLLKNVIQDMLITVGENLTPTINALAIVMRDELPKAAKFLGDIWSNVLYPPINKLVDAFLRLGSALGKALGGGESASWADVLAMALTGVANAVAQIANLLTPMISALASLAGNTMIAGLVKIATVLGGIVLSLKVARGLVGAFSGLGRTAVGLATFGKFGGKGAAAGPLDAASTQTAGSVARMGSSADMAAAALQRMGGAGTAAAARAAGNMMGPLGMMGPRIGESYTKGGSLLTLGQGGAPMLLSVGLAEKEAYLAKKRLYDAMGKGVTRTVMGMGMEKLGNTAAGRIVGQARDGVVNGLKSVGSDFKSMGRTLMTGGKAVGGSLLAGAKGAFGLVGKLFWPLIVADLALEFAKAPLGDFIASSTPWKRAGEKMKEDFFGGLVDMVTSWQAGQDLFVDMPTVPNVTGRKPIRTSDLRGIPNLTPEQIEALTNPSLGNKGYLTRATYLPTLTSGLMQRGNESVVKWYERIRESLDEADKGVMAGVMKNAGPEYWIEGTAGNRAVQQALAAVVANKVRVTTEAVDRDLRTAVVQAIEEVTGGHLPVLTKAALTDSDYRELALVYADAIAGNLNPLVVATMTATLLKTRTPKPYAFKPIQPTYGQAYGPMAATPLFQKGWAGAEMPPDTVAPGSVYGGVRRRAGYLQAATGQREDIGKIQKDYQTWWNALGAGRQEAQPEYMRVLRAFEAKIKQGAAKGANKEKLLATLNKTLGLTGGDKIMSWEQLIDWEAQLSEESGQNARTAINKALKDWSAGGAITGAEKGASEFNKWWGKQIEAADTAGLQKKVLLAINATLPKEMQFKDFPSLEKFFEGIKTEAAAQEITDKVTTALQTAGAALKTATGMVTGGKGGAISGGIETVLTQEIKGVSFLGEVGDAINFLGATLYQRIVDSVKRNIPGPLGGGAPHAATAKESGETGERRGWGGPVVRGRAYIVGDRGVPELFVPREGGMIVPGTKADPAQVRMGSGQGRGRGYTQQLFVDKLQVLGPAHEQSILAQVAGIMPAGIGG